MTESNLRQKMVRTIKGEFDIKVKIEDNGLLIIYNKGVRYCDYENMELFAQKVCNHLEGKFDSFFEYKIHPENKTIEIYYY